MSPTPILTLAELRCELDRLDAIRAQYSAKTEADPQNDALYADWEKALEACWEILNQVAAIPATSLSDLRVKAYVFNWSANLVDDESYTSPSDGEEQIMHQLVAGLLDDELPIDPDAENLSLARQLIVGTLEALPFSLMCVVIASVVSWWWLS